MDLLQTHTHIHGYIDPYPYPQEKLWVPRPLLGGKGTSRVWVRVYVRIPMGYPCLTLSPTIPKPPPLCYPLPSDIADAIYYAKQGQIYF